LARAEHEISTIELACRRRTEQLDVIDLGPVRARDAMHRQRLAHVPCERGERIGVACRYGNVPRCRGHEEPVAGPGDIAFYFAMCRHDDPSPPCVTMTRHVRHGHTMAVMQLDVYNADRCFDAMHAAFDAAEMRERDRDADRAMSAHPDESDIVEED